MDIKSALTFISENVRTIVLSVATVATMITGGVAYVSGDAPGWVPASRHYVEQHAIRLERIETLEKRINVLSTALEKLDPEDESYDAMSETLRDMQNELDAVQNS